MIRRSLLLLFLPFFAALSVRAAQPPLLARWTAAVGGAGRIARIDAVHRVEAIDDDGMPGTREEWATEQLQRREHIEHAHDQTLIVFDGRNGWRRDWNGFVEKLAGSDLRRQANTALLHTFAALRGEAGVPKTIGNDTLDFHVNNGSHVRFVFDPASGLPARAEMPSFDGTLTVTFADWRPVDGIKVPFEERWTTGPNKSIVHLRSIDFLPCGDVDLTPPSPGPEDASFQHGARSVSLAFNFDNKHIMLPTIVNGVGPIWFLLDTGAEYTVINRSHLAEFHMTPYGGLKTVGGGSEAAGGSYVEHVHYRLGDAELHDQHAAVLELRGLEEIYGMPVGGILGFDFLSRFVVDLDYAAERVILHPRTWDSHAEKGSVVPLVMQGEEPYLAGDIDVRGEAIPTWFILDLGAADTITFTTPFIAAHHLLERAGDRQRTVHKFAAPDVAAFNPVNVRGLIDAVTIGGVRFPHVLVNLSAAKGGAYTSPAFDGNLCETIVSRFGHVILDYGRSVMILRSRPSTTRPFEERKSFGMTVVAGSPDLHHFTVTSVGEGSPAAAAGFRKGDVIAAVDGEPAARMDLAALRALLLRDHTRHRFQIVRNGREVALQAAIEVRPISALR